MTRTYLDANILIAAFQGEGDGAMAAIAALDDPDREFVVSDFLRLETLPKPVFHRRAEEAQFMQAIFESAESVPTSEKLVQSAIRLASAYDLTPMDALHASAAVQAEVDVLLTLEKPTKPLCRLEEIQVQSLYVQTID
jgi:hypothetical protein